MKKLALNLCAVLVAAVFVGCQTPEGQTDRTATGGLAGAVLGAGTGALIGSLTGKEAEGAAIGGALGALTGGLVGHAMDSQQRQMERQMEHRRAAPAPYPQASAAQPLSIADIKAMAKAGISDEVIISQIRNSRTVYRLTTQEIIDLKDSGVSQKVIDFMINTPSLYPPPPR